MLTWLYPRATRWILNRNGIQGQEGITLLKETDEAEDDSELSDLILQCRANKKLIGTYLKKLNPESLPEDGRLRSRFLSMGARTGRFSVQGILHTIPRQQEIRELFVPEEGNCFVIADYSQIELRVSAELSGE